MNATRIPMISRIAILGLIAAIAVAPDAAAQTKGKTPSCCVPAKTTMKKTKAGAGKSQAKAGPDAAAPEAQVSASATVIPDALLLDQDGREVHLRELLRGKVVAMNFVFTTCTTICPPMGANFAKLRSLVGDAAGRDVMLVSVSIDPTTDTPARLKAWSEKFNAGPGWTLLTGGKREVDNLLKSLKVYAPIKEEHAPIVLIGREGEGNWIRANGLTAPEKLAEIVRGRLAAAPSREPATPARAAILHGMETGTDAADNPELKYFTDVKLRDQSGAELRLYSDLLKGKIVVINPFFAECTGSCPLMNTMMEQLQNHLGDRLGKDVELLSITVDPAHDTPSTLKEYADRFHAKPGWHFLSGSRENVELALRKLGQYVDARENHSTVVLIGNLSTRLWKKVNGLAPADEIIKSLDEVIADTGGTK